VPDRGEGGVGVKGGAEDFGRERTRIHANGKRGLGSHKEEATGTRP
jgi:hypothetical protein